MQSAASRADRALGTLPTCPSALLAKPARCALPLCSLRAAIFRDASHHNSRRQLDRVGAADQARRGGGGVAAPPPPPAAPPATTTNKEVVSSSWPCKTGELVKVMQQGPATGSQQHQVHIVVDASVMLPEKRIPRGCTVQLHWGVYRSSPHLWQHPQEVIPPGSTRNERSGAMVSAMSASADGTSYHITLSVPATLAPLTLAFVVRVEPPVGSANGSGSAAAVRPHFVTPLRGRHFAALIGCSPGSPKHPGAVLLPPPLHTAAGNGAGKPRAAPAGLSVVDTSPGAAAQQHRPVNFAVRCRGADRVCLVLLRPEQQGQWGMVELVLDPALNRTGEMWHIAVEGLHHLEGLCYGWRLEGDVSWESGQRIQPYQVLLDPWCPSMRYFPAGPATDASPLPLPCVELPDGAKVAALSSLDGLAAELARQEEARHGGPAAALPPPRFVPGPDHSVEELRFMEIDVRTFAQGKEVQHPGTYLGVAERAAHIRAVGANAVILTPCYATAKGIGLMSRAAVNFMAADSTLAAASSSSVTAAAEFRSMVSQLHAAGIEVLLMLELTFTAEGTDSHPNPLGLRGLDYGSYYRSNGVLNCGDPATQHYLLSVLRHWAGEGVDGFCFINAENLVIDREGIVLDAPPLADAICHDPVLRPLKLVALASDDSLLPRSGARGFPHWGLWQQRNTAFGADLMAFLAEGNPGMISTMAGRLTGSANIFDSDWDGGFPGNLAAGRRPAFGINSITVLGRQYLAELAVEAAELAAATAWHEAMGMPGPLASAATIAKSLQAVSILALGVPIVPQDTVADVAAAHFVGVLLRIRVRLASLLQPPRFDSPRDIRWHSAVDSMIEPIWDAELAAEAAAAGHRSTNYLAFSVRGVDGQAVYVGINPHPHCVGVSLPSPPAARTWERIVDTSLPPPEDALLEGGQPIGSTYDLAPKAVLVLQTAVLETVNLQQPPPLLGP